MTSEWERLADALARVVSAGISEHKAKLDLCQALVDGKIKHRSFIWFTTEDVLLTVLPVTACAFREGLRGEDSANWSGLLNQQFPRH